MIGEKYLPGNECRISGMLVHTPACFVEGVVEWVSGLVTEEPVMPWWYLRGLESHFTLYPTGQIRLSTASFEVGTEKRFLMKLKGNKWLISCASLGATSLKFFLKWNETLNQTVLLSLFVEWKGVLLVQVLSYNFYVVDVEKVAWCTFLMEIWFFW